MLRQRFATAAATITAAAFVATAPTASAMPVDNGGPAAPVHVVRVQVDEGLDWADAGLGAAGMLALVLVGFGGARTLSMVPARRRSTVHS
jgi:hypothetical protein